MQFQGDISSIPITDVAQNLSSNRKEGTLTIRRKDGIRKIAFREGKIISYTDDMGFSVPRWLLEKDLVEEGVLKKALAKSRRSRRKDLGQFLQAARAMKAEDYRGYLKSLVLEVLYETFTFRDGSFEFGEGDLEPAAMDPEILGAGLQIPVGPVILEAARRLDDWEAIRRSLPSSNDVYLVSPGDRERYGKEVEGDDLALGALELLDGTRTVGEVIALLPTSRFEGSRVLADLVAKKWARPIEGAEILKQMGGLRSKGERERAWVLLRAALEREPGNREVLRKVGDLSLELGKKEEGALYRKILAGALAEDGDGGGAEKALREALRLNPKDIGTWQKLYGILEGKGDEKTLLAFGCELAACLKRLGLEELARDHLAKMVERFPDHADLRMAHAHALFSLGKKEEAVEGLLLLVRDLLRKGFEDGAEKALRRVLTYDKDHKKAREVYEKIRSGKLARQKARRKRILRGSAAALVLACIGLFLGHDLFARREFVLTARQVFAEGLIEKGEYKEARERLEEVERRHWVSLLRFLEGRGIVEALREAEAKAAAKAAAKKEPPRKKSPK